MPSEDGGRQIDKVSHGNSFAKAIKIDSTQLFISISDKKLKTFDCFEGDTGAFKDRELELMAKTLAEELDDFFNVPIGGP